MCTLLGNMVKRMKKPPQQQKRQEKRIKFSLQFTQTVYITSPQSLAIPLLQFKFQIAAWTTRQNRNIHNALTKILAEVGKNRRETKQTNEICIIISFHLLYFHSERSEKTTSHRLHRRAFGYV